MVAKARNRIVPMLDRPGEMNVRWLSTQQIATRLGVAVRTVTKWIDQGKLQGIRLPGSRYRRVHPDVLAEFERHYGFDRARGVREG